MRARTHAWTRHEQGVDFEADVFRLDFTNLVTSTVVNGLPALQNSGKTRFKGLELASDWRLPRHVNGRVTYSFHDSTFVDFVQAFDGVPTQLAGLRLEMSPRHLFGAGLIYAPDRGVFGSVADSTGIINHGLQLPLIRMFAGDHAFDGDSFMTTMKHNYTSSFYPAVGWLAQFIAALS